MMHENVCLHTDCCNFLSRLQPFPDSKPFKTKHCMARCCYLDHHDRLHDYNFNEIYILYVQFRFARPIIERLTCIEYRETTSLYSRTKFVRPMICLAMGSPTLKNSYLELSNSTVYLKLLIK